MEDRIVYNSYCRNYNFRRLSKALSELNANAFQISLRRTNIRRNMTLFEHDAFEASYSLKCHTYLFKFNKCILEYTHNLLALKFLHTQLYV